MPRRTDIEKILVLGSGPIVIGQACEFDYSGTQAIKALREEGYGVVLLNSNPATVMTDPGLADKTYIEPLVPEALESVLAAERPQAVLASMGGQTALNLAAEAGRRGLLRKFGAETIGAGLQTIRKAEDRALFKRAMETIKVAVPRSLPFSSVAQARRAGARIGFPLVIRASYTLGGWGGGIARDMAELAWKAEAALAASPVRRALAEESLLGFKEFELEVMRDALGNFIVVAAIENIDPMGVHTGDSWCVCPTQTLSDRQYQEMRDDAARIVAAIGLEGGGCNVQFAVCPKTGRRLAIEVNPRVSRSSALASKATGFPIARVAAKLAVGFSLPEIDNPATKATSACFEPSVDYVAVKAPRFAEEKFGEMDLDTSMKSVGEVLAMGRTFKEAFQKALSGLEDVRAAFGPGRGARPAGGRSRRLGRPTSGRMRDLHGALASGEDVRLLHRATGIDPWFLGEMAELVGFEKRIRRGPLSRILREAKRLGFSDESIARLAGKSEEGVRAARRRLGLAPSFKSVDTCAGEFSARTPYFYSSYERRGDFKPPRSRKIAIIGSGPNRIGQGLEFDHCCVEAARAVSKLGFDAVMINSNPETVSTDYDAAARLYFEPLSLEHVLNVLDFERPDGVLVQMGGQTPLNLAASIEKAGFKILGTQPEMSKTAGDRELFAALLRRLGLRAPPGASARGPSDLKAVGRKIGFPLIGRPSFVLGGASMMVFKDERSLLERFGRAEASGFPVFMNRFLENALEFEADLVLDGRDVLMPAVMEHVEEAGVHSGDSRCFLPPRSLSLERVEEAFSQARALARGLGAVGLLNVQWAMKDGELFVLEANPRASRTVPFVSKATGLSLAGLAASAMAGLPLRRSVPRKLLNVAPAPLPYAAAKDPVFPFSRIPGADSSLGPEMRSTGEAMGLGPDADAALAKAAAGTGRFPWPRGRRLDVKPLQSYHRRS